MNTQLVLQLVTILGSLLKLTIDNGPTIIQTVQNAEIYAKQLFNQLMGRDATAEEEAQIYAGIQALSAHLQTPLPPADDQDV